MQALKTNVVCLAAVLVVLRATAVCEASVRDGVKLRITNNEMTAFVEPLSDDVVRVRAAHTGSLGRNHSYAVAKSE